MDSGTVTIYNIPHPDIIFWMGSVWMYPPLPKEGEVLKTPRVGEFVEMEKGDLREVERVEHRYYSRMASVHIILKEGL